MLNFLIVTHLLPIMKGLGISPKVLIHTDFSQCGRELFSKVTLICVLDSPIQFCMRDGGLGHREAGGQEMA